MIFYDMTEDILKRHLDALIDADIAASGANAAYIDAAKKLIRQEMEKAGINKGTVFICEGLRFVAGDPGIEWRTNAPVLRCTPFTKKGTPSKVETTNVYVAGIQDSTIVKE